MNVLDQGVNPIFTDPDPDKAREFFRKKPRAMTDKRMTENEVVQKFIPDGCYLGIGGFGANRIPTATSIPFYLVDAVVEVPYGSYPGNMPYLYFSDEEHLAAWMKAEKDPREFEKFLDHHIYSVSCFEEYLERCGGLKKLKELQKQETLVDK